MPDHTGRLVLTTLDPRTAPDPDLVTDVLCQTGFIVAPLPDEEHAFAVGPSFLSLLAFAGCAVTIPTGEDNAPRCQVRVPVPESAPRLLWGRNTRPPRCPGCRARLQDWRERLPDWQGRPAVGAACPACGEIRPPWRWDWKQQGGFGRLFVLVEEVFPGEAVPSPRLLDLLTRACGCGWRHFYIQD
jgi:hypothetical protein